MTYDKTILATEGASVTNEKHIGPGHAFLAQDYLNDLSESIEGYMHEGLNATGIYRATSAITHALLAVADAINGEQGGRFRQDDQKERA